MTAWEAWTVVGVRRIIVHAPDPASAKAAAGRELGIGSMFVQVREIQPHRKEP